MLCEFWLFGSVLYVHKRIVCWHLWQNRLVHSRKWSSRCGETWRNGSGQQDPTSTADPPAAGVPLLFGPQARLAEAKQRKVEPQGVLRTLWLPQSRCCCQAWKRHDWHDVCHPCGGCRHNTCSGGAACRPEQSCVRPGRDGILRWADTTHGCGQELPGQHGSWCYLAAVCVRWDVLGCVR